MLFLTFVTSELVSNGGLQKGAFMLLPPSRLYLRRLVHRPPGDPFTSMFSLWPSYQLPMPLTLQFLLLGYTTFSGR